MTDLRKITVADLLTALARGEAWAWTLSRRIVAAAALVAKAPMRGYPTPPPGPRRAHVA